MLGLPQQMKYFKFQFDNYLSDWLLKAWPSCDKFASFSLKCSFPAVIRGQKCDPCLYEAWLIPCRFFWKYPFFHPCSMNHCFGESSDSLICRYLYQMFMLLTLLGMMWHLPNEQKKAIIYISRMGINHISMYVLWKVPLSLSMRQMVTLHPNECTSDQVNPYIFQCHILCCQPCASIHCEECKLQKFWDGRGSC